MFSTLNFQHASLRLDCTSALVYLNLLDLLDRRHCLSTIIWLFCSITSFPGRLQVLSALITSSSLSGDFPLLPDFRDFLCDWILLSACCNAFSARTDLSPLSPTRTFNTSFFSLIAHIGFSDASRIFRRILHHFSDNQTTTLPAVGTVLSFMGPGIPSLAVFLSCVLGSHPWLFSSLHVHLARVSSNIPLTFWLTASLAILSSVSRHTSRDSAFPRSLLAASSVANS